MTIHYIRYILYALPFHHHCEILVELAAQEHVLQLWPEVPYSLHPFEKNESVYATQKLFP